MKNQFLKITALAISLTCFSLQGWTQAANLPPIKGVGIVIKKNPGSGASKLVPTNDEGETVITITAKGNYVLTTPKELLQNNQKPILIGLCKNKLGIIESFYTPNKNGEVELNNLVPGNYYLKLINNPEISCPPGYIMEKGICVLQKTTINGKIVVTICTEGVRQCLLLNSNEEFESTTDAKYCPDLGKECEEAGIIRIKNVGRITMTEINENNNPTIPNVNSTGEVRDDISSTLTTNNRWCSTGTQLSIGTGLNMVSSATKNRSNALNDLQFMVDLYVPIAPISNNVDFGFSTSFQYAMAMGDFTTDGYSVYNIDGQSAPPTIAARGAGSPKHAGFRGVAAPQMNIRSNRLTISPSFEEAQFNLSATFFNAGKKQEAFLNHAFSITLFK
jgi:hypothetical protein